jgi:hypothetical protein
VYLLPIVQWWKELTKKDTSPLAGPGMI